MFDQYPATSVVFLRWGSVFDSFKQALARLRRKARHLLCTVVNGGHDLYRARTDTRLFQQCLLCGYETAGWAIDLSKRNRPIKPSHAVTQPRRRPRAVA